MNEETIWHGRFIANLPCEADPNLQITTRVDPISEPDILGNAFHAITVTVRVGGTE